MKSFIISCTALLASSICFSQASSNAADVARIKLAAYVPQQIENMPEAARSMLQNKLSQIITQNGMGGSAYSERFIITANITVMTKDITPTAPPMHAYTLDVTLYIGDGITGTKFSSQSVTLKGVGENETKAYIAALKNLKTSDPTYQAFLETGKNKIIEYYKANCDLIIKEAQMLAKQNKEDEAIFNLGAVPQACKECYDKAMDAILPIYKQKIDRECKVKLLEANNLWGANQSVDAANSAGEILSSIDPAASCFAEAKALSSKIAARVKEIDAREWKYILKEQAQESERIQAIRDIGVAYGKGQPKTVTYNVRGWW